MLLPLKKRHKVKVALPLDVYLVIRELLMSKHKFEREKENFWTVLLDAENKITAIDHISTGDLRSVIVSPRETFRFAILKGAASVIVCHNHPSGNLQPSRADKKLINKLVEAGKIIGIEILDALIITEKSYNSFL